MRRAAGSGSGSPPGRPPGWCAQIAGEAGTTRLAVRVRADPRRAPDRGRLPVAQPHPRPGARPGGGPRCSTRCRAPTSRSWSARRPDTVRDAERGPGPTTLRPRVPIVAVTGTNGKTTTSRMVAHIAPHPRPARRLVEHRRHLRRRRAGRARRLLRSLGGRARARAQAGAARGHRDRPWRHPAQGHRPDPQRRLGLHQRLRGPPRAARHRHPRPARRGQGRRPADHQVRWLGGAQRRRPPGLRDAYVDPGQAVGVLPRPRLARDPRDAVARAAGRPRSSTAGSRCSTPTATRTRWSRSSTSR